MPPRVLSRINSACGHVISAERVFLRRLSHKPFAILWSASLSSKESYSRFLRSLRPRARYKAVGFWLRASRGVGESGI